jgi:hypothetical protein
MLEEAGIRPVLVDAYVMLNVLRAQKRPERL